MEIVPSKASPSVPGQPSRLVRVCSGRAGETGRVCDLVNQARAGDAQAFGELYRLYRPMVRSYIASRLDARHRPLVDDVVSEVFTQALAGIATFNRCGQLKSWLMTIAHNRVIDVFRSERARPEARHSLSIVDRPDLGTDTEGAALSRLTAETVHRAVSRLDPAYRRVVELRFLLGYSVSESAHAMGRTPDAVRSLQRRALATLAEALPTGVAS
jgi:RNA polymerase sigma-70 factor, ECF subfamily